MNKILAEHRAGELIASIPRNTPKGQRNGNKGLSATLADSHIPIRTAHNWQAISTIPIARIETAEADKVINL